MFPSGSNDWRNTKDDYILYKRMIVIAYKSNDHKTNNYIDSGDNKNNDMLNFESVFHCAV